MIACFMHVSYLYLLPVMIVYLNVPTSGIINMVKMFKINY
jgi:hypothetical protein